MPELKNQAPNMYVDYPDNGDYDLMIAMLKLVRTLTVIGLTINIFAPTKFVTHAVEEWQAIYSSTTETTATTVVPELEITYTSGTSHPTYEEWQTI